jgi:hypothetical protein
MMSFSVTWKIKLSLLLPTSCNFFCVLILNFIHITTGEKTKIENDPIFQTLASIAEIVI